MALTYARHQRQRIHAHQWTPVVRLTPITKRNSLADVYGALPGRFIDDTFDDLPEDIANAFGMQ